MNKNKKHNLKSAFDDLILAVICIIAVLAMNKKCSGFVNSEPATPKTEKAQQIPADTVRNYIVPAKTR